MQMLNIIVKKASFAFFQAQQPRSVRKDVMYADRAQQAFGGKNASWSLTIYKDYCGRRSDVIVL